MDDQSDPAVEYRRLSRRDLSAASSRCGSWGSMIASPAGSSARA